MIDTTDLTLRSSNEHYYSYHLPNKCVLYVAYSQDLQYNEITQNFNRAFAGAMMAGREMIRKGECERFSVQTVDVAKDDPDTHMLILMVQ